MLDYILYNSLKNLYLNINHWKDTTGFTMVNSIYDANLTSQYTLDIMVGEYCLFATGDPPTTTLKSIKNIGAEHIWVIPVKDYNVPDAKYSEMYRFIEHVR